LYLKRLVVGGFERVFEINRNFRNEGISTQHNPEFTMLEFYQAYATYEDLMEMTEELIGSLVKAINEKSNKKGYQLTYGERTLDFSSPWKRVTICEAIREHLKTHREAEIQNLADKDLEDLVQLKNIAQKMEISFEDNVDVGHLQMHLFEELVESTLIQPTFVTQFPVVVSPLSRRNPKNPQYVDRFELIVCGREIANAFSELNDPVDQRQRFEVQMSRRKGGDEEAMILDEDFIRALEHGMPPTAGEGIGIDRLVMLLTDSPSIREVILFPLLRLDQGK
jgi:lysyl-tRNA synthetase class 2